MDKSYILKEHIISSDMFLGIDEPLDFKSVKDKMSVSIIKYDKNDSIEFDLVGYTPSLVNAFRRILLSDVPSMAIEKVLIYNNTSLIQDEVLAHRLGLIPLKADARLFQFKTEEDAEPTDEDTLKFELKVKCCWKNNANPNSEDPNELYVNQNIYSKHIKWIPFGAQADSYSHEEIGPVHDDILIDKLRPGHELDIQLLAVKGIGRDHAKFSPVATASYRLLPIIELTKKVQGDAALKLQSSFSPGVIGIRENRDGKKEAYVKDARYDGCSRNVLRYNDLKDSVRMGRRNDHFIFTIETVGAIPPDELFLESINVLRAKCKLFLDQLNSVK